MLLIFGAFATFAITKAEERMSWYENDYREFIEECNRTADDVTNLDPKNMDMDQLKRILTDLVSRQSEIAIYMAMFAGIDLDEGLEEDEEYYEEDSESENSKGI